jgi:hypothetical protein
MRFRRPASLLFFSIAIQLVGCASDPQTTHIIAHFHLDHPPSSEMAALIANVKDARYFDIRAGEVSAKSDDVWLAVQEALKRQDDVILYADKEAGNIVTDQSRAGLLGFPHYDKYYIHVDEIDPQSSRVEYLYLRYWRDMQDGNIRRILLRPETNREFIERCCDQFEDNIAECLPKH